MLSMDEVLVLMEKVRLEGPEALTEEEKQAVIEWANAVAAALKPIMEAFYKAIAEVAESIVEFWQSLPEPTRQQIVEVTKLPAEQTVQQRKDIITNISYGPSMPRINDLVTDQERAVFGPRADRYRS